MPDVSYQLKIDGFPAPPEVLDAAQQVEVEDHALLADMLRLTIGIGANDEGGHWSVLDLDLFRRLTPIELTVTVGTGPGEPLLRGYVTETSVSFSGEPEASVLNVVAMDPTVLMHLEERVRSWPNLADSDIAAVIFSDYQFTPQVEQTQPSRQEVDATTMQRGSDIAFLQQLARRNGFECYVEVNPKTGAVEGHFHPPRLQQSPQGVLSVSMGAATNVDAFNARYEMLSPTTAQVAGVDVESVAEQPSQAESMALAGLGKQASLSADRPRRVLLSQTGLSQTGELQTLAQAVTDRSAWAIKAEGELNTAAYGGILRAKRPVEVRGAGPSFSGTYYVEQVLHTLGAEGHTQRFTLRRNALGLTGQERFTEDLGL